MNCDFCGTVTENVYKHIEFECSECGLSRADCIISYNGQTNTDHVGACDCDDMTILFASLLKCVGFEEIVARIVSVQGTTWDHIYPLVKLPRGGWVAMDATEKGKHLGWEYANVAARRDFAL